MASTGVPWNFFFLALDSTNGDDGSFTSEFLGLPGSTSPPSKSLGDNLGAPLEDDGGAFDRASRSSGPPMFTRTLPLGMPRYSHRGCHRNFELISRPRLFNSVGRSDKAKACAPSDTVSSSERLSSLPSSSSRMGRLVVR